jgi:hypothetical protein
MSNRYFSTIVLSAFIIAGVFACKKDDPKTPPSKECKDKPTGTPFSDVPNLDFEDWYSGKSAGLNAQDYYNPNPKDFWATPNNGSGDLGVAKIPIVVFRVGGDSAHSGNYAAMLKTTQGELLGKSKLIAATIASGNFEIDISDPFNSLKFGKPFNKKPKTVSGYYRYFPVGGDSASAYCYLTKFDANCKLDTIGFGRKMFYDQQSEYAKFEFNVEYKNTETPDNIVIYFSSSEEGDVFKGQVGNTLFIDDVTVGY